MDILRRTAFLFVVTLGLAACVTVEPSYNQAALRLPENIFGDHARKINAQTDAVEQHARGVRRRSQYPPIQLASLSEFIPAGKQLPVIVYFHGCAGILKVSIDHIRALSELDDFVIIAPNSFAADRPEYCFADFTVNSAMTGQVSTMRQDEIKLALSRVSALPWVDKSNIFLIGHSQGGGTVASYSGAVQIRGRILLNGACGKWMGGNGMRASEALLTLDTGHDRWFRRFASYCRDYVLSRGGRSIYEPRGTSHDLAKPYWPEILEFITKNRE